MNDPLAMNMSAWDARTPYHLRSNFYGVDRFLAGDLTLKPLERELCGDVRELDLLHLQCHFGLDTLSWARLGARSTGVDFSPVAIAAAVELAGWTGLAAEFIEADVTLLPSMLANRFDRVVSTYGALCWIPDLRHWATQAAMALRSDGLLVVVEFHPMLDVLAGGCVSKGDNYFGTEPRQVRSRGTYAERDAPIDYSECLWQHPVSETIGALIAAGLTIEHFGEHPFCSYPIVPELDRFEDGYWHDSAAPYRAAFLYSVVARK